jgi:hypothetical protein
MRITRELRIKWAQLLIGIDVFNLVIRGTNPSPAIVEQIATFTGLQVLCMNEPREADEWLQDANDVEKRTNFRAAIQSALKEVSRTRRMPVNISTVVLHLDSEMDFTKIFRKSCGLGRSCGC